MFFANKNVLVTGGSGLVGCNLIAKLLTQGAHVRATWHHKKPVFDPSVDYLHADLTFGEDCARATENINYVFMCAASTSGASAMTNTPLIHVTPNICMNSLLLNAAYDANVEKVMYLSSTTGYPVTDQPVKEEQMFEGDPYDKYFPVGWMKHYVEVLCRMYSEKLVRKMPCLVLRPSNIFGPGDKFHPNKSHVLPALIRKVCEKQNPIQVWGTGDDVRDFIYVDDMTDAMLLAMEKLDSYNPINIGDGQVYTVKQVLEIICRLENHPYNPVFDNSKPTMIPYRAVDTTKAKNVLGFTPKTSLEQGIAQTIAWYKQWGATID